MENLVPLGTGNSRLMKSNIPASTTLAQLIQMWNNGTFPYDIGPLNSAGISQQGTPLNKDTLLKDATAALYGLTNTAVPDDVLAKLSKAAFVEDGAVTDIDGNIVGPQIEIGSYVGTGTYGAKNPTSITFSGQPDLIIIFGSQFDSYTHRNTPILLWGFTTAFNPSSNNTDAQNSVSYSGTTVSWYNSNDGDYQLNFKGNIYKYLAFYTGGGRLNHLRN